MQRIAILAAAFLMTVGSAQASGIEDRAQASREAVKMFFGQLKGELESALGSAGPVGAIEVCNIKAPAIAGEISERKGWKIGRTSLKLRNPGNAPDAWELAVLEKFERRRAAGEDPAKIEFYEIVEENGGKAFRYMKAIPTAEKPCLMCHGKNIPTEVSAKLDDLYPDDKARGYGAGELRGAFTIVQPMD